MSNTKSYLNAFAPKADQPPEERPRSSLAQTLLEQMYGADANAALLEAAEGDASLWPEEQRELAWMLLSGEKDFKDLTQSERSQLDEMALRIHQAPKPVNAPQQNTPRVSHEPPPQLLMPDLDRPAAEDGGQIIVGGEWPDLG